MALRTPTICFVNDEDDACRRLQEAAEKVETPDLIAESQPSEQQKHEAEIASMALAVLVRLTANAGGPQSPLCKTGCLSVMPD